MLSPLSKRGNFGHHSMGFNFSSKYGTPTGHAAQIEGMGAIPESQKKSNN